MVFEWCSEVSGPSVFSLSVVDAQVLSDYVKTDWRDYRERILGKAR